MAAHPCDCRGEPTGTEVRNEVRTQTPKESALSERKRYEWKTNDDDNDTDKTMNGEGSQHDEVSEKNEGRKNHRRTQEIRRW